jgi:hypothetical protein
MRPVPRRGWGPVLALVVIGGLLVAGRLIDLPDRRPPPRPSPPPATAAPVVATPPRPRPAVIPRALWRPLRLPALRPDGSCPATPAVGPPRTRDHPVAAVAVGGGPVIPVLFRSTVAGRLDRSVVVYWDAPGQVGGVMIVRGHRLGAPGDRVRFQQGSQAATPVHVLDPASAFRAGVEGRWWRFTRLRAGPGCYGLQIDGLRFSEVLVVRFA